MKIYLIQAKIVDIYRGDSSYRDFEYYEKKEVAEKNMIELQREWSKYKDCFAIFYLKEIEVIE